MASEKVSSQASRWSTINQEAYAIYYAIRKLISYLRGHRLVVQTDYRNLLFINQTDTGRVGRWRLLLQEFEYAIAHKPEKGKTDC